MEIDLMLGTVTGKDIDQFSVTGAVKNLVSGKFLQQLPIPAVPQNAKRCAEITVHTADIGMKAAGNFRIQTFGHPKQVGVVLNSQLYCINKKVIPQQCRMNAETMDEAM